MSHETMNKLTNQSRKPMKSQQLKPLICKRMLGCRKEKDMSCKCHECGKQYKIDLIIPDELWEQIKPNGKLLGASLLCSLCIMEKLEKMDKYDYWYITKLTKVKQLVSLAQSGVRFFSFYKQGWSKLVNEDRVINHLTTGDGKSLCGIEKRHPDIYHTGFCPIEAIEKEEAYICRLCYRIYKKI